MPTDKHQIVIVGGGSAGITVAARLIRRGYGGVAVIEPADTHYYQPLWTLVGAGEVTPTPTARPEASVMPNAASWIKNATSAVDPDSNTASRIIVSTYQYGLLPGAPGARL